MNHRTLGRQTTVWCLLALPVLAGPAKQAPLRQASPGEEALNALPAQSGTVTQTQRLNAAGTALFYSTYRGGSGGSV